MSTSSTRSDVLSCLSAGFCLLLRISCRDAFTYPRWLADDDVSKPAMPQVMNFDLEALRLSRRQNEILSLLAQGMSNKEIARELNIAEGTSKIHTAALLRALGARNRTEAAFMAAKLVGSIDRSWRQLKSKRFNPHGATRSMDDGFGLRQESVQGMPWTHPFRRPIIRSGQ
jgi:DNA-binding CsgD family transcriptional regulator